MEKLLGKNIVVEREERRGGVVGEALIAGIKELYPNGNQPVFYSADENLRKLISRERLSNILTVAQYHQIIPIPHLIERNANEKAFLSRDEIIRAVAFREQLRQRDVGLEREAKRIRKVRASQFLTLREAAERLAMPVSVMCHLITSGKISLGNQNLDESIRRIKKPQPYRTRLVNLALLKRKFVQEQILSWKNRHKNLETLTIAAFRGHRDDFATVTEVAKCAGLHPSSRDISQLAQILTERKISIACLQMGKQQSYWVLLKEDKVRAADILRKAKGAEKFRQNPVKKICGPEIPLPSTYQITDRQKYLPVDPSLRLLDVRTGRRPNNTIANFFGDNSPVSILKYGREYYFPAEQSKTFCQFVQNKLSGK